MARKWCHIASSYIWCLWRSSIAPAHIHSLLEYLWDYILQEIHMDVSHSMLQNPMVEHHVPH